MGKYEEEVGFSNEISYASIKEEKLKWKVKMLPSISIYGSLPRSQGPHV